MLDVGHLRAALADDDRAEQAAGRVERVVGPVVVVGPDADRVRGGLPRVGELLAGRDEAAGPRVVAEVGAVVVGVVADAVRVHRHGLARASCRRCGSARRARRRPRRGASGPGIRAGAERRGEPVGHLLVDEGAERRALPVIALPCQSSRPVGAMSQPTLRAWIQYSRRTPPGCGLGAGELLREPARRAGGAARARRRRRRGLAAPGRSGRPARRRWCTGGRCPHRAGRTIGERCGGQASRDGTLEVRSENTGAGN